MPEWFRDRQRAESFGSIAEQYDRFRPEPAPAFLDELAATRPDAVLDVGCGTGKVARGLLRRGLSVLGVELDARMAHVARSHGVEVEVAGFEEWDDRGRTFDLITFGDSWHWIDPQRGWRKIARILRPGGTVARFWSRHEVDEPLRSALKAVHERVAPELANRPPPHAREESDPRVEHRSYPWDRAYTADEWVAFISTFSVNQTLEPARLAQLQREVRATIEAHGGTVHVRGATDVSRSRAAPR